MLALPIPPVLPVPPEPLLAAVAELLAAAGRSVLDVPPQPASATAATASPAADHREIELREVTKG
jgi:hypothetical protein